MADLSVALIAASDSNLFFVPNDYGRDVTNEILPRLNSDATNIATFGANAARRAIKIESAIATLLVSQPCDEFISVGAARDDGGLLRIYISGNGANVSLSRLQNARKHLECIWEMLGSIAEEQVQHGAETPQNVKLRHGFDLVLPIYRHSIEKVAACIKKAESLGIKNLITQAIATPAPEYVVDEVSSKSGEAYILASEVPLLKMLLGVLGLFKVYRDQPTDKHLKIFASVLIQVDGRLKALGDSIWSEAFNSFFSRCDRIRELLPALVTLWARIMVFVTVKQKFKPSLEKPSSFARFWKKTFSIHHAIEQLMILTVSGTMRHQLKGPFEVVIVPPQTRIFDYDLSDKLFSAVFDRVPPHRTRRFYTSESLTGSAIRSGSSSGAPTKISSDSAPQKLTTSLYDSDRYWSSYDKFIEHYSHTRPLRERKEVHVHCELNLLAHFLEHGIGAYGFIAVSKLCCLGCWLYFFAYNELAEKKGWRRYYTIGTSSKAYWGWVKPASRLDRNVESILVKDAETHFAAVKNVFSERKLSDSTTTSESRIEWLDLHEFIEAEGGEDALLSSALESSLP